MGAASSHNSRLQRRALRLEWSTNAWNLMEVAVTVSLGLAAGSLALIAFGLDSLVEVFASTVVIWSLRSAPRRPDADPHLRALRLIAIAFWLLGACLVGAAARSLALAEHPGHSPGGIAYLAVTAVVMFGLAHQKRALAGIMTSAPLAKEATMTFLDGCLSVGILTALAVNIAWGWWWADGAAAIGVAAWAIREGFRCWWEGALGRG